VEEPIPPASAAVVVLSEAVADLRVVKAASSNNGSLGVRLAGTVATQDTSSSGSNVTSSVLSPTASVVACLCN